MGIAIMVALLKTSMHQSLFGLIFIEIYEQLFSEYKTYSIIGFYELKKVDTNPVNIDWGIRNLSALTLIPSAIWQNCSDRTWYI
jgi:hypothetical protein